MLYYSFPVGVINFFGGGWIYFLDSFCWGILIEIVFIMLNKVYVACVKSGS